MRSGAVGGPYVGAPGAVAISTAPGANEQPTGERMKSTMTHWPPRIQTLAREVNDYVIEKYGSLHGWQVAIEAGEPAACQADQMVRDLAALMLDVLCDLDPNPTIH